MILPYQLSLFPFQLSLLEEHEREMKGFVYVWHWAKWPRESWSKKGKYKGKFCRVLCRGGKNSALIEFEDGKKFIVSRNGLRKEKNRKLPYK